MRKHTKTNRKKRNAIIAMTMGIVLVAAIVGFSLNWGGILPSGDNPSNVIDNPSFNGSLTSGTAGAQSGEVGSVPAGYNNTTGTAINNSNKDTLRSATSGNYYLTEDITDFTFNNNVPSGGSDAYEFAGTLDGNGHSITIKGGTYSFNKSAGGVFGTIAGGTVKNLTVIYNSDLTANKTHSDEGRGGVGLLVGLFKSGTIENVRTVINSGVTVKNGGSYFSAIGGMAGIVGNHNAVAHTYFNRCKVEINGTLKNGLNNDKWVMVGGLVGIAESWAKNPEHWDNRFWINIDGFILTGSGQMAVETGSGAYGKRIGGIVGAYNGQTDCGITATGYIFDMYNSSPFVNAERKAYGGAMGWDGDSAAGTVNISYTTTNRAGALPSGARNNDYGTLTKKNNLTISNPTTGVTVKGIGFDENNIITMLYENTRTDSLDFIVKRSGSQIGIVNNWKNYEKINVTLCAWGDFTGSETVTAETPVNAANAAQFTDALNAGRSVGLSTNVDLGAGAFAVNADYKGYINGNNKTVTFTGVSSSTYGDNTQGGLLKKTTGARIENLSVIYNLSGSITKNATASGDTKFGLIAGEARDTEFEGVSVTLNGGTLILTNSNGSQNVAVGGLVGLASGTVLMKNVTATIAAGAKLQAGTTAQSYCWIGGIVGNVYNTDRITIEKVAVLGSGTLESATRQPEAVSRRVSGMIGGVRGTDGSAGAVTVTDYAYGFNGVMTGDSAAFSTVLNYDLVNKTAPVVSVTRIYRYDDGMENFTKSSSSTASPSLSGETKLSPHPFDETGAVLSAYTLTLGVNAGFTNLIVTAPKIAYGENYIYMLELRSTGGVVQNSVMMDSEAESYTLQTTLSAYTTLGVYMKISRSVNLPDDLNRYEHGYTDSGYAERMGYFDEGSGFTEINKTVNSSSLADLTDGNWFLTEDLEIAGFLSTHTFSGVLDGCGHTVTIIADGGGIGANGNLGGLFAELTGTVKNLRVVVKASVARTSGILRFGLLAGRADAGAKLYNVKVSMNAGTRSSISNTVAVTVGGIVGLAEGSDANPVLMSGVTMELNGELQASGEWSWIGGIVGRVGVTAASGVSGTRKLTAKQVVFRGDYGVFNNVDMAGTDERSSGFGMVGGYGTGVVSTLEVDGFINAFTGKVVSDLYTYGATADSSVAVIKLNNVYKTDGTTGISGTTWANGSNQTITNESLVNTAFTQNGNLDMSLGYTVALFDPAAVNTDDGTTDLTDSLVVAAIFEDNKESEFFVADIEIVFKDTSKTGSDAVSLVNVFYLTPNEAYGEIRVQIRSGAANDGKAGITGDLYGSAANSYTEGWLTDNGRVPAMLGVPTGASAISSTSDLINWLEGKNAAGIAFNDVTSNAYLYGYLTQDFIVTGLQGVVDRRLQAGRTLDGMGRSISVVSGVPMGAVDSYSGYMSNSTDSTKLIGELLTVNNGTVKNLTMALKGDRTYTSPAQGQIYGGMVAVNNGIIENCKVKNDNIMRPKGNGSDKHVVVGGIAGVNRGTIRYSTFENNGEFNASEGTSAQKIAGGIAGVNDGGLIEYVVVTGNANGKFLIGNSATYKAFLGGIVGYARISREAPAMTVGAGGGVPAQGTIRYALYNFAGELRTGASTVQTLYYGAIAGYLIASNSVSFNPALGFYAAVKNGAGNMSYSYFTEQGGAVTTAQKLAFTCFAGGDSGITNASFGGGGAISVSYDGTANAVANDNNHHFWWDYWGGTGELRYEVYRSASVNAMTTSGDRASVNPNRGTAAITKETAAYQGAPKAYSIATTFRNGGTYTDYLNGIKNIGSAPITNTNNGTDLASKDGTSISDALLGSGSANYYLSKDITVNVDNKRSQNLEYNGTFDGQGHTITIETSSGDNKIDASVSADKGAYGFLFDKGSGTIKNVKIVYKGKVKIWWSANNRDGRYYAGIVGGNFKGKMENVTLEMAGGSKFWYEGNSSAGVWINNQWGYTHVGSLLGNQGGNGSLIKNCKVVYGAGAVLSARSGTSGTGAVGYNIGVIATQTVGDGLNSYVENLVVTGSPTYDVSYYMKDGVERRAGLILGRQEPNCSVNNVYLENVNLTIQGDSGRDYKGSLIYDRNGTIGNVYLIGTNKVNDTVPSTGVVSGTFMANSVDEMLAIFRNATNLSSEISNGVDGTDTSEAIRNLFVNFAEYKISNFQAGYKLVTRYPELGYYLTSLTSGANALSATDDGTVYSAPNVTAANQMPTALEIGVRAKINLVYYNKDSLGNERAEISDTDTITMEYTGSTETGYEFRAVTWGDGTAGTGSTVPLAWKIGGKIYSGRIPTPAALAVNLFADAAGQVPETLPDYAYQNASALTSIKSEKVHFAGAAKIQVVQTGLTVVSDTDDPAADAKDQWKNRSTLTFSLNSDAADGAITQVLYQVYDPEKGEWGSWNNILKCNNYQNGRATVTISFESVKGGSHIRFRGYSGVSLVTTDSAETIVRVDTSYPTVGWEENSAPLSSNQLERILVVDDVSVGDLTKDDGVLTITGPEGQNLDYELTADFKTSGNIRVFAADKEGAVSGAYVFTVKDAMGRTGAVTETIDFTPPEVTANVSTAAGTGVVAINNPNANAMISLTDNYTDAEALLASLKVHFYKKGTEEKALNSLSVADGTITTEAFDTAAGSGTVSLKLPEAYSDGYADIVFEATDAAGNKAQVKVLEGQNVIVDTREYTVSVKKPQTEGTPYATDGISYRLNGTVYQATAGTDGTTLHILKMHLFDTLDIRYTKRDGYTYGGYSVSVAGDTLGTIENGVVYKLGDSLTGDLTAEVERTIEFEATEELKITINSHATGAGALKNGNFSDTIADYIDPDTGASNLINFLTPDAAVKSWSAAEKDYTTDKGWTIKDYFDVKLTDPTGAVVSPTDAAGNEVSQDQEGAVLTFKKADAEHFVEGTYTLELTLKAGIAKIYTVLEGSTTSFTVSAKNRRAVDITYAGATEYVYSGEQAVADDSGKVIFGYDDEGNALYGDFGVEFNPGAFDEEEKNETDEQNLANLKTNLKDLDLRLYYNGSFRGSKIGGVQEGSLSIRDAGTYTLTVSIPTSFRGVTGSATFTLTVSKRTIDVYADAQTVMYGDAIKSDQYRFVGMVGEDAGAIQADGSVLPADVKEGVLTSFPKVATEYFNVRYAQGAVAAYQNGAVVTGGIAKNYNFALHNADLTIVPRDIILKINDARKTYGESDPSLAFFGLSTTQTWEDENGATHYNKGFGYSDNYRSFVGADFRREEGETAFYSDGSQILYAIYGTLTNQNYNVKVENGVFRIARRELQFNINGDQGLVFEEGIVHEISAKIKNGVTKDRLSVRVVYDFDRGNWTDIGTHYYRLIVAQNGEENSKAFYQNYAYNADWIGVVIGASILNIVVLPQVLYYGEEPALYDADGNPNFVLEGIKEEDRQYVKVTLSIPAEYAGVGYHAGAIVAEVSFEGSDVNYTPIVRKGNLTVLPKELELNWSGNFNAVYTGESLDKQITAVVKTMTADPLNVQIDFVPGNPKSAGNYTATASLSGANAENYIIRPEDRARQFYVQKSEQRIASAQTYNPALNQYPTYDTELQYAATGQNGNRVYRARIAFRSLLEIMVNTPGGYRTTSDRLPTITYYALSGSGNSLSGTSSLKTVKAADLDDVIYLEAGTYTLVAELEGDGNYLGNTYIFTFIVKEKQENRLNNGSSNGNTMDVKQASTAFRAESIGETVSISNADGLGYVVGPNAVGDSRTPVVTSNGVSRTMTSSIGNSGTDYNTQLSDGKFGSHDGDWAYVYFNVSVSESLRQLILQGKVKMQLSVDATTQMAGVAWKEKNPPWSYEWVANGDVGAWREDTIDTTNLSYMVRELSSSEDTTLDAADNSMIGLDATPYNIADTMMSYGQAEGYSVVSGGIRQLLQGELTQYSLFTSNQAVCQPVGGNFEESVTLDTNKVKSGSAFRVYFLSTTIGSTRASTKITGDVGAASKYLGNKRNNFSFQNIKVTFTANEDAENSVTKDTKAPEVTAELTQDALTKANKFRFTVNDGVTGTGLDFSSISAIADGVKLTPGNGLTLVSKEYMAESATPIVRRAIFETGAVSASATLGTFTVKDNAGNAYSSPPQIDRDTVSPTLGDPQLSPNRNFDAEREASQTFWYNEKQYLSFAATDDSGVIPSYGIYYYDSRGARIDVPSELSSGRIVSQTAVGTGLYYIWAEDEQGNRTIITFNLLVDESTKNGVEIVLDPEIEISGDGGSWQKGNVTIKNSAEPFGDSFGRMYFATSETDFRETYMTDPDLIWFAMDVEYADGKYILSDTITTATKKYYAFKYVAGSASYPGAEDNATAYAYLGLIKIDREEPTIVAESRKVIEKNGGDPDSWEKEGISSGEWTNKEVVFEISGTTGLSKGHLEYTKNGVNAEDSDWARPGDAGYVIYYFNYVTNEYTQTFSEEDCFRASNTAKTSFEYKAYLLISGHNTGDVYAFRFKNGANSTAVSELGVSDSGRDNGFKIAIDVLAPEVTSINSSWQPNETKSQIYLSESDSGVKNVVVYRQKTDADGNGVFLNGAPEYEAESVAAENVNGRWYFTFSGLWYRIEATDVAGNTGSKEVKLKIDPKDPVVTIENGAPAYSAKTVIGNPSEEDQKLGIGVWAYLGADGNAYIDFKFTVTGGISGFAFAYSTVGFTTIESEWIKPGSEYNVPELGDGESAYRHEFTFRVALDRTETYLFRFTSGAQKSVYFNFATGAAEAYDAQHENDYVYRVNIDATPAVADGFEYGLDSQWLPLEGYDDSKWVTKEALGIRFTASDSRVNGAETGLKRVTMQKEGGSEEEIVAEQGYYVYRISESAVYTFRVYDTAGNVWEHTVPAMKIDLVAPEITLNAVTDDGNAYAERADDGSYTTKGWTNRSVTLKYALTYGGSGISSILFKKTGADDRVYNEEELLNGIVFADDFDGEAELLIKNGAGLTKSVKIRVSIDKTKPTFEVFGIPSTATVDPVELTITTADGGSGVKTAFMTFEGMDAAVDVKGGYTFTVRDWRIYSVTVEDNAGNVFTDSFFANVDATEPEGFTMSAKLGEEAYLGGNWSNAPVTLVFGVTFQTIAGVTNYGVIQYRVKGTDEWRTLFDASDHVDGANPGVYTYEMGGEMNGIYEFRASTLAGRPSAETATLDLKIDTVKPTLNAAGFVGGKGGAEFVPDATGKGYTWISEDVAVTLNCAVGISGGKLYYDYKKSESDAYARTEIAGAVAKDGTLSYAFTVREEGFYRFILAGNADTADEAAAIVDWKEVKRDEIAPTIRLKAVRETDTGRIAYTLGSWTKDSVTVLVELTFGASYLDSVLKLSTGDSVLDYQDAEGYDPKNAEMGEDGLYYYAYELKLTENSALNYDFRVVSGAGIVRTEEIRRSGGAVRIDKNMPKLTVESAVSNGAPYAELNADGSWTSAGWTNQNVTFTFLVRTYLSGGTLRYSYDGVSYTADNIASYGSAASGSDENGAYSERRFTLTLSGENIAVNSVLRFRVESGSGVYSNDAEEPSAMVEIKIDKTRPLVDENSIVKTPKVPVNTFTAEDVTIVFEVYDPAVGGIMSGVKKVEFGRMNGSLFETIQTLTEGESGKYSVTVRDNERYLLRVTDFAGNYSDFAIKENIDKTVPEIEIDTDYASGSLSTEPIVFRFGNSRYGVSGAKVQYKVGDGAWIDAADVGAVFEFRETLFTGDVSFRLVSGSGVEGAVKTIRIVQDLNEYAVTVTEKVVSNGSFAANINYVKNGSGSAAAPTMKKGETLTLQITEKAENPLDKVYVNGVETAFENQNGRKQFSVTIEGNTEIELKFREIVSVKFDEDKLSQSIRVKDGVNARVIEPFSIFGDRAGFQYEATYQMIQDEYGNAVADGAVSAKVPQAMGTYAISFKVTGDYTDVYEFSAESDGRVLKVYYFDKIATASVEYYEIASAYDLAYIRYSLKDGVEFRQTRDITVTSEVASRNGGDWTVGDMTSGVYNGANFKIVFLKMETAGVPIFGNILKGAAVRNVGLTIDGTVFTVADRAKFAPIAQNVSGTLSNVYVTGRASVRGSDAQTAGIAASFEKDAAVSNLFAGLKLDVTGVSGDDTIAAGAVVENSANVKTAFSVGSIAGGKNYTKGNMLGYVNNGNFERSVVIDSALYSGTEVLASAVYEGVTVVKYWDLNDMTKSYWDIGILAETLSPKSETVTVKMLVDDLLGGLKFETDDQGNRYIPISNYDELTMIDNFPWADYRQTADVDCGAKAVAIARNAPFTGTFDGQGFVISNVKVSGGDYDDGYGMFGHVTGTIQNVIVKELSVDLRSIAASEATVGGLVKNLVGGKVLNVSVGGTLLAGVPSGTLVVGGVIGKASGGAEISRVLDTVSVTTDGATRQVYAGSIVGAVSASSVTDVYSIAKVDAYYAKRGAVGQLIGLIEEVEGSVADRGYSVLGVTYSNGNAIEKTIGSDAAGAGKENFGFIPYSEMMDAEMHPDFRVGDKHVSYTLKTLFPFKKGTGVEQDPFEITTAEEFRLIGNYLYAHYNIMNDIDFGGNFETIGKGMKFTGSITGVNKAEETVRTLKGVTAALIDLNYGTVKSLVVETEVSTDVRENTVFGAIANENYGTISYVKANGRLRINGIGVATLIVGGVVGKNFGEIANTTTNLDAVFGTVDLKYGGIAGTTEGGRLYKNAVQGNFSATVISASVGMFAGVLRDTEVVRDTNSSGAYIDVFLTGEVNRVPVDALYGQKI